MNLENAMIGEGNTMIIGTQPEDIEDMKDRIAEILTKVQDGNMDKDAIIEQMTEMKKDLLGKLDTLQTTLKEARDTLDAKMKEIEEQTQVIIKYAVRILKLIMSEI